MGADISFECGRVEMQHSIVYVNGQFVQHTFHFLPNSPLRSFIWALLGNLFATRYPRDLKNFIGPVWAIFQLTALLKQNPGVTIFYPGIYTSIRIFTTNVVGHRC